jgi:hypothetical protein
MASGRFPGGTPTESNKIIAGDIPPGCGSAPFVPVQHETVQVYVTYFSGKRNHWAENGHLAGGRIRQTR